MHIAPNGKRAPAAYHLNDREGHFCTCEQLSARDPKAVLRPLFDRRGLHSCKASLWRANAHTWAGRTVWLALDAAFLEIAWIRPACCCGRTGVGAEPGLAGGCFSGGRTAGGGCAGGGRGGSCWLSAFAAGRCLTCTCLGTWLVDELAVVVAGVGLGVVCWAATADELAGAEPTGAELDAGCCARPPPGAASSSSAASSSDEPLMASSRACATRSRSSVGTRPNITASSPELAVHTLCTDCHKSSSAASSLHDMAAKGELAEKLHTLVPRGASAPRTQRTSYEQRAGTSGLTLYEQHRTLVNHCTRAIPDNAIGRI